MKKFSRLLTVSLLISGAMIYWPRPLTPEVEQVFRQTHQMNLYSLGKREGPSLTALPENRAGFFRARPILGTVSLSPQESRDLLEHLKAGIRWGRFKPSKTRCHYPHHYVEAQSKGMTVQFSLCFECQNYELFSQGIQVQQGNFLARRSYFDGLLQRHGQTLPPIREYP